MKSNSGKSQQFRQQIRRKYIDELCQKQRKAMFQKINSQIDNPIEITPQRIEHLIASKQSQQLYNLLLSQNSLVKIIPTRLWMALLKLLTTEDSLKNLQCMHLLSIIILQCCSKYQEEKQIRCIITDFISNEKICQKIYHTISLGINCMHRKMLKMYLYFLKNCSLVRIQDVRRPDLVKQYLPILQKQFLNQPSFLLVLTYIGQQLKYQPHLIAEICNEGLKLDPAPKLIVANILINYVILEQNSENIQILFFHLLGIFQHLYMNCHKYNTSIAGYILASIGTIIEKYPINYEIQMLQNIKNSKIQNFLLLLLQVAQAPIKLKVFEIQQILIQKCIQNLGSQIFQHISEQVIDKVLQGIQYNQYEIVQKCLKILVILCQVAGETKLRSLNENQLTYVLKQLCYHQNQYINSTAQIVLSYFEKLENQDNQMNIQ